MRLTDGVAIVAKVDNHREPQLAKEGAMLRYLARHSRLPIPSVLYCSDSLLLMEFIEGASSFTASSQQHAAELLADLHEIRAPRFGFEEDTLIGGLNQPNPWTDSWIEFFRDQRLLSMGMEAMTAGRLPRKLFSRLEKFAARLTHRLSEPTHASLIHGDIWGGNVLAHAGRISGFVDPAIYYAHAEIELAFITLFGTFGTDFFERYHEIRPIAPGFMAERRDIYNLYPLLVHVRLFGGGYVDSVDRTLRHFGY